MPRLLQINVTANWGSTGKIAEDIGKLAQSIGYESWIGYGRGNPRSCSNLIRIGNNLDMRMHGLQTRFFDNHGRASIISTKKFLSEVDKINPDIIHLHNIHGYYINYPLLFKFLKEIKRPVVWTLHDCWALTGHCSHFMTRNCDRWKSECHDCPLKKEYPASYLFDQSTRNHRLKKRYFSSIVDRLTLVSVSDYVAELVSESFLNDAEICTIHNGIDIDNFCVCTDSKEKIILGVSNVWTTRKGLDDFYSLRSVMPDDYRIVLVGLNDRQISTLPSGIEGLTRTSTQKELAELYSKAMVLVNPTYEDNYPTVNLEAIACGTPVITYRTGGSPEAITDETGIVVEQGDINGIVAGIKRIENGEFSSDRCRRHAELFFDRNICFTKYINLYNELLSR